LGLPKGILRTMFAQLNFNLCLLGQFWQLNLNEKHYEGLKMQCSSVALKFTVMQKKRLLKGK
jgi:hypothetical protein